MKIHSPVIPADHQSPSTDNTHPGVRRSLPFWRNQTRLPLGLLALWFLGITASAQTLLNIDFGVGTRSVKSGFAATGQATNDFWNLYSHYQPKFLPGMPLVADGQLGNLKFADGTETKISLQVSNAPGVWGNASGDPMYDTFLFAQNGSNLTVTLHGLGAGRYHLFLYGHADPDVTAEQNSAFTVRLGTNVFGPLTQLGGSGWRTNSLWQENHQFVVFRDLPVPGDKPLIIEAAAGPNGVAVINGLQLLSRGTSPPKLLAALAPRPLADTNLFFVHTNLLIREARFDGKVTDTEARFTVNLVVESQSTNELSAPLFEGDVAVVAPDVPEGLRILSGPRQYRLVSTKPGQHAFKLEVVAKIAKVEPWNQISFTGPNASIATINAVASTPGIEMQLLSGTQLDADQKATSKLSGFLGADRCLSMRWQSKAAEVARKSLLTVDTLATAQITPTVIKFNTQFRYEILQAPLPKLSLALPPSLALTKVEGDQIRDWSVKSEAGRPVLTVEFIKPVEKSYALTLLSEQPVETAPLTAQIALPQPLEVERESGSLSVAADDMVVEIESALGLRQVNAAAGMVAAYRFHGRPFTLAAKLKRMEPVVKAHDRVTARLEETRLLVTHALTLTVEKSGIYAVELTPQTGFVVADVKGEAVEDWKASAGKLRVSFSSRVLGSRKLDVQLEQPQKTFPEQIAVSALRVTGATNETAQIGAASGLGIRLKTAGELVGLREIPVTSLANRADELLAFAADQPDWKLTLAAERLPARVIADVFNLVTIGDGLVGGSATIRYGILNQGVQEFKVRLPAHWKNIEFTGPNIRRKELTAPPANADSNSVPWTISLQDKAWGGYTLVVTYDYQFDPKAALLDLAGAHVDGVEREGGSVAITAAASMELETKSADPLRQIDQSELAETDRALITRPVLRAYRYDGSRFALSAALTRHQELDSMLNAVADRTQVTSVLTEDGQMLAQASFMVKNNDKQFQKFRLPPGAELYGCYVNNEPVKAEQDGAWLLVSLPRGANRDEAFAVDIKYRQKFDPLQGRVLPRRLEFAAPMSDVPNTYAEWQFHAPTSQRLSSFGGNMTVARGTVYGLREGWQRFTGFYGDLFRDYGAALIVYGGIGLLGVALVVAWSRRGFKGIGAVIVVFCILFVIAGMMLPALSKAKAKAQRVSAISSLKQIALAARMWANDNNDVLPASVDQMKGQLGGEKVLTDPQSGGQFVYVGAGKRGENPNLVVAYSPVDINGRVVAFADGSVRQLSSEKFAQALEIDRQVAQGLAVPGLALEQSRAVQAQQLAQRPAQRMPTAPPPPLINAPAAQPPLPVIGGVNPGDWVDSSGARRSTTPPGATPMAAGIRPIRIDIPLSGVAYNFTKVLNVSDEPLAVKVSIEPLKSFQTRRSVLQLLAFIVGLAIVWREWRRQPTRGWALALGLALVIGAVGHLLIAARALHLALMVASPALALLALLWLAAKFWPRFRKAPTPQPPPLESAAAGSVSPSAPPAVAGWIALLSLATLGALSVSAQEAAKVSVTNRGPQFAIQNASYTGAVRDKVAQFDATLLITTFTTNQTVALFAADVALQEFAVNATNAHLLRDRGTVSVWLPKAGSAKVQAKLAVKLGGDVTKRQLAFGIAPALASSLKLTIDEEDADVEFPSAVSFSRKREARQTTVDAIMGAGDRVEMFWTPRMKRVAETAASVFANNTTLVTVGGGAVNTRTRLDYQVSQGELRQIKVRLPAGQRLLRVDGELIRVWELKEDAGTQTLVVDLVKAVAPAYKLTVETERLLDKLPATVGVALPQALEVIRETGLIGLRGSEELTLNVETATDLQRVDLAEFTAAEKADGLVTAYRYLKPGFQLAARAEAIQPQIEALVHNATRVGFEAVALTARVDYTIKKAGVFTLRLALPAGYKLYSVNGPSGALPWTEKDNPRTIDVQLKERTQGAFPLRLYLSRLHKEPPKTVEVAGVTPLDTAKLTGYVSVSADSGVAVKTTAFDGLTEIPAAQLGDVSGHAESAPQARTSASAQAAVLAYKSIGTEPATAAQWKLSVATETVESWVRAEVASVFTVTETLVSGRAVIRYDIQNAPVKEFRVRMPAACTNVDVTGTNIRRRDQEGAEWRVELQNKVRGSYTLTFTWEQPRDTRSNAVINISGLTTAGTERETGYVVMLAKPPLQVIPKSASDALLKIDTREVPDWAGVPAVGATGEVPVLAHRYLRPGYGLVLEARRYEEAAVLQALVDSARLTTVVADDGQMMTEMTLQIRNNGLQNLAVELPTNHTVWSAFIAGQPVRPTLKGSKLLLPLERSTGDALVNVEMIYVARDKFPRTHGKVILTSPKLDVPMKNARWELYLPPDYDYTRFEGTMKHEDESAPVLQVFSSSEYFKQEQAKKVVRLNEANRALSNVKSQLAVGNWRVANEEFNNAYAINANGDVQMTRELEGLKKDLSREQGRNLIQAQRAYTAKNVGKLAAVDVPQTQQAEQAAQMVQYDQEVAERQAEQLQKAQQLTVAKAQPLRANLPTRGLRHSFTQVLQTEVNKPMTVHFTAANTKEIGWFKLFSYFLGGFLMLWILSAVLASRKERTGSALA